MKRVTVSFQLGVLGLASVVSFESPGRFDMELDAVLSIHVFARPKSGINLMATKVESEIICQSSCSCKQFHRHPPASHQVRFRFASTASEEPVIIKPGGGPAF